MVLCGIVCMTLLIAGIALRKKSIWQNIRSPCLILLVFGILGFLAGAQEDGTDRISGGVVRRPLPGEGDLETEAIFCLGEDGTEYPVMLTIEAQTYQASEEKRLLAAAEKEIKKTFPGENASPEQILSDPVVLEEYQDGAVLAEWTFSDTDIISEEGKINQEALTKGKKNIEAFVSLKCGDSENFYSFSFWAVPKTKSKKEQAALEIKEEVSLQDNSKENVILPDTVCGQKVSWRTQPSVQPAEILGLGILASAAGVYGAREQKERQKQKRRRNLLLSYPEFVGKLSLLLGAGMTISGALRKMDQMYRKRKTTKEKKEAAYEELRRMIVEIDNGMGEVRAIQEFAKRCDLQPYRKLALLLISGQKAGNRKLMEQLNEEADRVFLERKNAAQKIGEEAATKMLFPMLLMLLIVMAIILVPAFLSFYK